MADEEVDWKSVSDDSIERDIRTNKNTRKSYDFDDDDDEFENEKEIDVDLDLADNNENDEDNDNNNTNNSKEGNKKQNNKDTRSISDSVDNNSDTVVRKSNSADDLFNLNGNSTVSNREESRSAGSNRAKTYSFDTEDSSVSDRRSSVKKTRKTVSRNWNDPSNSQSPTPTPNTSVDKTVRSDESDEFNRRRFSSDELSSPRYRLESFDNRFSFDDSDVNRQFADPDFDDDDDDDDELFLYEGDHGLYSDPSDDDDLEAEVDINKKNSRKESIKKDGTRKASVRKASVRKASVRKENHNNNNNNNLKKERNKDNGNNNIKQDDNNNDIKETNNNNNKDSSEIKKSSTDYFENDEDSNSNILPSQPENSPTLNLNNSVKSLNKASSVVVPVDDHDRPRTGSDKSRTRLGSDKDNETRSPIAASFSSTNSSSISPEPMNRISGISPKSPPSMISDQLNDEVGVNSSLPQKTNKPSQLQVMASQRWNNKNSGNGNGSGSGSGSNFNSKKSKPSFAKFTEVHSFANAVKIVPDCDGALVLCATADSTVRLIDAISGKIVGMYEGHSDRVLAVSINEKIPGHDDTIQYVVAGSRDENVCVWNFKTRACLQVLSGHDGAVWAVAVYVSLNGPPLAFSGSSDCSIRSWNILTGEVQHIFKGHSDTVLSLTLHNGGQYTLSNECRIISGGADHMVRVWDMMSGRHCRMLEGHTDDVNAVGVVEDSFGKLFRGVKIISGGRDRIIRVWDLQRGAQIAEFAGHADCVYGVCGMVGRFSTLPGIPTSKQKSMPTHMPHSNSTRGTVVGHLNRSSSVWLKQDSISNNLNDNQLPEIFLIASCSEDRTIKLWDVLGERLLVTSKLHKGSVKGLSLSPVALSIDPSNNSQSASLLLASCSWDKSVLFYDLDNLLAGDEKKSCCTIS